MMEEKNERHTFQLVKRAAAKEFFTAVTVLRASRVRKYCRKASVKSRKGGVITSWLAANLTARASAEEGGFLGPGGPRMPLAIASRRPYHQWKKGPARGKGGTGAFIRSDRSWWNRIGSLPVTKRPYAPNTAIRLASREGHLEPFPAVLLCEGGTEGEGV